MKPRVCACVAQTRIEGVLKHIALAERLGADLVEVRLDYMASLEGIEGLPKASSLPLIATNRPKDQGGKCILPEPDRLASLLKAAEHGFDYVDLELTTNGLEGIIHELKEYGAKPIVSFHDFEGTPPKERLKEIIAQELKAGAEICKLVTMAKDMTDNLSCLFVAAEEGKRMKIVCFAMGPLGFLSRALSPLFGAYFTYASLGKGLETAPGQWSLRNLKALYKHLGIDGETF
ncbi:type I 3-dehydroquinate dehydratase [Candidatus Bathyarchaeota archaeon]|nr:type I 3-dehydroquinate dehydratase [Candidatus Bathyarchaeota archaeon]MBS7628149.1 type I 3-dehydroquinate dehydratase [Candidatus Bathyarchaeota archaeon]